MQKSAITQAFARSELFAACDFEKIIYRTQSFEKGVQLPTMLEGKPVVGLIVRGKVLVYSLGYDGTAVALSSLNAGESFGISNIFTGEDLSTLLISDIATTVVYIPKHCFLELLEQTPGMMIRYSTLCNRKLKYLTDKIEFLTIPSCRARLVVYLLRNNTDNRVVLEFSKEQLARMLGVSHATLFRELRYLSDQGCIQVQKKTILLENPDSLSRLIQNAS